MDYIYRNLSLMDGVIIECERCGAVVWNTVAHTRWHENADSSKEA